MRGVHRSTAGESADEARSFVLGTAGHIDHGKTALVFALTGTDTDRLPEEKSRGITIDLGFASLQLRDEKGDLLEVSVIDVPGHQAFVSNMLAGAAGVDCAMLIVAADDGVRPQTREHLAICELLNIPRGLVALTKMDLVTPERLEVAREEVARLVKGTFLQDAPVTAVSALTREGITELKVQMGRVLSGMPARSMDRITRLPLDRAFSVRGFGTVVTGTLQSGSIRAQDVLELQPAARTVRVRGVQVHGRSRIEAHAPSRIALNLSGVEVQQVRRGDTLVPAGTLEPVQTVDAIVCGVAGAPPLKHRLRVRVHAFTSDAGATLLLYEKEAESGGGAMRVRLKLAKPLLLAPGDRFVLRQPSPALTIGGGMVLEAHPLPGVKKARAAEWIARLQEATPAQQILLRVERRGVRGISLRELVKETGLQEAPIAAPAASWVADQRLVEADVGGGLGRGFLSAEGLAEAKELILRELGRSKDGGMRRAELRSKMRLEKWVFEVVLADLRRSRQVELREESLAIAVNGVEGALIEDGRLKMIERVYQKAGLASPLVSDVEGKLGFAPKEIRAMISALIRAKRLVRMGSDNLLIHSDVLEQLIADLRKHRGESFDVARFKSFTGLTRKHAIPLLEYLDGARVMRNSNGTRVVL